MPRIARLITSFSHKEIGTLLKSARTVTRHPGLDIRVAAKSAAYARILVITSRKMGIAPHRNKVRRRIKALFYTHELFERNLDMVIYCKTESYSIPFTELSNILLKAAGPATPIATEALPPCNS